MLASPAHPGAMVTGTAEPAEARSGPRADAGSDRLA